MSFLWFHFSSCGILDVLLLLLLSFLTFLPILILWPHSRSRFYNGRLRPLPCSKTGYYSTHYQISCWPLLVLGHLGQLYYLQPQTRSLAALYSSLLPQWGVVDTGLFGIQSPYSDLASTVGWSLSLSTFRLHRVEHSRAIAYLWTQTPAVPSLQILIRLHFHFTVKSVKILLFIKPDCIYLIFSFCTVSPFDTSLAQKGCV